MNAAQSSYTTEKLGHENIIGFFNPFANNDSSTE